MDKSSIEGNAVDYVKIALRSTKIIKPELKEGDKTLSWDGELFVYNSEIFSKDNLKTIIPVQVKGRTLKKYANTHPIDVSDLVNFKKKKNILYFVVQIVNDEYRICYLALQLYDLEKLLKNIGKRKYEQNKSEINFINLTQTVKRKQKLTKDTIQHLVSLKNSSSKVDIKLACCILLEAKLECEQYLFELDHAQIEEFQHYPIMNLYSQR